MRDRGNARAYELSSSNAFSAEAVLLLSAYGKNQKEDLSNDDKKNIRRVVEAFKASIEA